MLIQKIRARNVLSFGPEGIDLDLNGLNVFIGPNSSGKSNLIEVIDLLRSAPRNLTEPIRSGGGVQNWIWRGGPRTETAAVETILENPNRIQKLRYTFSFKESAQRFELVREYLGNEHAFGDHAQPYIYYEQNDGHAVLNYKDATSRHLQPEEIKGSESILSQRKDPDHYPELTYVGDALSRIRLYREWRFGRHMPARLPQMADQPNNFLQEDGGNLGLVLSNLRRDPPVKKRLLYELRKLHEGIADFEVTIEGGNVQVFWKKTSFPFRRRAWRTVQCDFYACWQSFAIHRRRRSYA